MFTGDKLIVERKYSDDEKNTPLTTVLVMKIGGHNGEGGVGIHGRHLDAQSRIQYLSTDRQRQTIPRVTYVDDDGKKIDFASTELKLTAAQIAGGESRAMDCIDCHNRPAHNFLAPERAVDQAMSEGLINVDIPFIKKKAVEALKVAYPNRDSATRGIAASLNDFYRSSYPDAVRDKQPAIAAAIAHVQAIYLQNIFPAMNVTWGSYPNNLGHADFPGCFRCHDGSHTTADGKRTITNDCDACHTLLAVDDPNPKVIAELGMK